MKSYISKDVIIEYIEINRQRIKIEWTSFWNLVEKSQTKFKKKDKSIPKTFLEQVEIMSTCRQVFGSNTLRVIYRTGFIEMSNLRCKNNSIPRTKCLLFASQCLVINWLHRVCFHLPTLGTQRMTQCAHTHAHRLQNINGLFQDYFTNCCGAVFFSEGWIRPQ